MLRGALVVLVASALAVPQADASGAKIRGGPQRAPEVVPWFLLDGATRLGVFPHWFVSDYYPYYIYRSVYRYPAQVDFIVGCPLIKRPVLGIYGWRARTMPACG